MSGLLTIPADVTRTIAVYMPVKRGIVLIAADGRSIELDEDDACQLAAAIVAALGVPAHAAQLAAS